MSAAGGETADVGTLFRSLAVSNYKQEAEQPVYSPKSGLERHEHRSDHVEHDLGLQCSKTFVDANCLLFRHNSKRTCCFKASMVPHFA